MNYTYHYCARVQRSTGGFHYVDGIVTVDYPVKSQEDYTVLKHNMFEKCSNNIGTDIQLSITSLTLLHTEQQ